MLKPNLSDLFSAWNHERAKSALTSENLIKVENELDRRFKDILREAVLLGGQ